MLSEVQEEHKQPETMANEKSNSLRFSSATRMSSCRTRERSTWEVNKRFPMLTPKEIELDAAIYGRTLLE